MWQGRDAELSLMAAEVEADNRPGIRISSAA
jgi:hypothetical protein